jgi:hypothetical protein
MPYRPKSTLEQWRILQAVVDAGGYSQAADLLNKSQSSLNRWQNYKTSSVSNCCR